MLRQVLWKDVREQVQQLLPDFVAVIDKINPDNDHYLYLVQYPYGAVPLEKGVFQVPNSDNHIVPLTHSTIPKKIQTDLAYSGTVPLGLVMKNSIEAFMYAHERVIPSSMVKAGQFISLWRVLDEGISFHAGRFWNITSGARSICMMPKITDKSGHKALKSKYGLKLHVPQKLREHWELFTHIANHPNFTQPWESVVLFFGSEWFSHTKDDHWTKFYYYLFNTVWQPAGSAFRRNQFIFDYAFSLAQENRNLRPNPYLADTVRYLISVGNSAAPGFAPAIDDSAAPISGLQRAYLEDYDLKKYAPVIMHLHHFSPEEQRVLYYSFQLPTTNIFSPKSRKLSSAMVELQEVKYIMETLISEILRGNLEVENTPLFELAQKVRYNYYHSEKDKANEILPAGEIMKIDDNFAKTIVNDIQYVFPEFAPFFRGCVSISNVS